MPLSNFKQSGTASSNLAWLVLVCIGFICWMIINITARDERARAEQTTANAALLQQAADNFLVEYGRYPSNVAELRECLEVDSLVNPWTGEAEPSNSGAIGSCSYTPDSAGYTVTYYPGRHKKFELHELHFNAAFQP